MSLLEGSPAPFRSGGQGAEREGLVELLGNGHLGETWVREGAEGQEAAKRLRVEPGLRGQALAGLRRLSEVRGSCLVPVLRGLDHRGEVWVDAELDRGMPLRRMLSVAVLTPGQAALIVEGVLCGLDQLRQVGLSHGDLHDNQVHVGTKGQVRLGDWGLRALVAPARFDDRVQAAALLGQLVGERRPTPAWRTATSSRFRELLQRGSGEDEALEELRRAAAAVLEESGRERAVRELAALVRALERRAPEPPPLPALEAPEPVAARPEVATGSPPPSELERPDQMPALPARAGGLWRPATVRWGLGGAAVVAVGALALWAGLHAHGAARPTLRQAARPPAATPLPAPAPTPTPSPVPSPVPAFAPQQAGPITGVQLQSLGPCSPGGQCEVRVTVNLTGNASSLPLAWTLDVFDRCTGRVTQLPGVQMTAGPGWNYAWGISYPTLPTGRALALVAVTTSPAQAASAPLMLPSGAASCS